MNKRILFIVVALILISYLPGKGTHSLGFIPEPPWEIENLKYEDIEVRETLRDSVSHITGMPPVGDQGSLKSSVGWALGYYYKTYQEYIDNNHWDTSDSSHIFDPLFIYNQINGGDDVGGLISDAVKCLNDFGCAPYTSTNINSNDPITWPSEKAYNDAITYRCKQGLFAIYILNDNGIDQLKQHLSDSDNAVVPIKVWNSFYNDTFGLDYVYDTGDLGGQYRGGQWVCIMGYNDSLDTPDGKGAFRLVNSWGTSWGDNGYFWMTYDVMKSSDFVIYQTAYYTKDRRNYNPNTKGIVKLTHPRRAYVKFSFKLPDNSWESSEFFNWNHIIEDYHSFPSHPVIVDLSDMDEHISLFDKDTITFTIFDIENDGIEGNIENVSIQKQDQGRYIPSLSTPQSMVDSGSTDISIEYPLYVNYWQSFQRLPDNSSFIDYPTYSVTAFDSVWAFSTNDTIKSSPVIADINGDNIVEIVVGSCDSCIYVIDKDGNPVWVDTLNGKIEGSPAVADLDGDGIAEVVVTTDNSQLACLNGEDGSEEWTHNFISGIRSSPVISSVDSDHNLEVIGVGLFLRVINGEDGSTSWMYMNGSPGLCSPCVGDIIGFDGIEDIAIGQGNSVKIYDGYHQRPSITITTSDEVLSTPTIGDINADSLNEVLFGSNNDTLYALLGDSVLWKYGTGGDVRSSPAIADIDGDGINEIVFGSNDGYIYALNGGDGSILWAYQTNEEMQSSPSLCDFNRDGLIDVVEASTQGRIYIISGDGTLLWGLNVGTSFYSSPALGDVDSDGNIDIAIGGTNGKLYFFSGYFAGIEEKDRDYKFYISAQKGPVRNSTIIFYSIPRKSNIDLSLFDVTGRRIKTIINGKKEKGEYRVDIGLNGIVNGVYFYQLKMHKRSITRKLIVLR